MSSLFEYPIVLIVVVVTTLIHEIFEYFPHVVVIGPLLELQIPTILQIGVEFLWDASRQRFDSCRHFLILDAIVLIIFVFTLKALPW